MYCGEYTHDQNAYRKMFSSFFINMVQNIRRDLQTDQMHDIDQDIDTSSVNTPLERFTHASEDEVKTLIMKSPSKSCSLDPMPTWLLKLCVSELVPIITAIVNVSMDICRVPPVFKCAQIRPLLKKPTLDSDILNKLQTRIQPWWKMVFTMSSS